jgi:hypothetical protein
VFGATPAIADARERLEAIPGSRHVTRLGDGDDGITMLLIGGCSTLLVQRRLAREVSRRGTSAGTTRA